MPRGINRGGVSLMVSSPTGYGTVPSVPQDTDGPRMLGHGGFPQGGSEVTYLNRAFL